MIVVFTVSNRPHYLARTLESWSRVRGAGGVTARFFCEPGCPEAVEMCLRATFFWNTQVVLHECRAGVLVNPWIALSSAFADRDFAVLAEEDLIVSADTLEYFGWASERFEDDGEVLGVCAHSGAESADLAAVHLADGFSPWVWGTWWDRWGATLSPTWDKDYSSGGAGDSGWDWNINKRIMPRNGYKMVMPEVTRSQNIGQYGGAHALPADFAGTQVASFRENVPPQQYRLAT